MNEIKRYDQELRDHLEQIALPDEDLAWAEMKKMLDKDDDDPVIVPFFRRYGCALLGLAGLLLLLTAGWFYYKKTTKEKILQVADSPARKDTAGKNSATGIAERATGLKDTMTPSAGSRVPENTASMPLVPLEPTEVRTSATVINYNSKTIMKVRPPQPGENDGSMPGKINNNRRAAGGATKVNVYPGSSAGEERGAADDSSPDDSIYTEPGKNNTGVQIPATDSMLHSDKKDSSVPVKKATPVINKTTAATPSTEKENKNNDWLLGAGLTVYQPFPLDGESAVPYNRYGRKGSLADYIPSAYFRVYRRNKWFIHTEFRYGAPQSVKPFNYKQDFMTDSSQAVIRSVYQLRKTYYHQVPLSFHYMVLPGLSVGTGVIYNHFGGAVSNQDVYRGNNGAVDTLIFSGIVRDRDKSRFVKNHFQWSVEAQYQWKRISIGARYSRDINPYIRYTDIFTGTSVEKKATALNVFLRYELWKRK